ncbi:hypothetical protein SADUNF_Sadunf09G0014200 [Salix dunnii]|uniref:Thaumatin-like protein n=1 Tax=Salix dunnii TaxID=1413687 RepID=A0A835JSI8_9ROSI|nr:hypothetical protein SADUNF_Sadunf09G0014200 [Salix dunnii]
MTLHDTWSGHLRARTQCSEDSSGKLVCATADCASGAIDGAGAISPQRMWCTRLFIDGFNIPISRQEDSPRCNSTICAANVNAVCDPSSAVRALDGTVIACKVPVWHLTSQNSAAQVDDHNLVLEKEKTHDIDINSVQRGQMGLCSPVRVYQPKFCCTGEFRTPNKCLAYQLIKNLQATVPSSLQLRYDDKGSIYLITFCQ